MNNVTHLDTTHGFDTRTACGKSTHIYADAMRRNPIQITRDANRVSCKRCRKVLDQR